MKCDLHVHSRHSGMCHVPVVKKVCRECYSEPEQVYATLKRRGMDLVTLTDHDSIDGAESLRHYPDFFLSEEVTCRLPSGTIIHVGVYDLTEHQHVQVQRRRDDIVSLLMYLTEKRLFFAINHVFSSLTGRREPEDFAWFDEYFPAVETLNGLMLPETNRQAARLAETLGKVAIAGSDAHSLDSLATACTKVDGASDKDEFLAGLRNGAASAVGESGSYWKCTRDVLLVAAGMMREKPWTAVLALLLPLVPVVTLANHFSEISFVNRWAGRPSPEEDFVERVPFRANAPAIEA